MTPNPHTRPSVDPDPRLLLPEWLRDEPQTDVAPPPPEEMPPEQLAGQRAPESDPVAPVSAKWEEPPAPIERYDPSGLISPDDLPAWIRGFAQAEPSRTQAQLQFGRPAESAVGGVDQSNFESLPLASAAPATGGENDIPAVTTASDLTETRFVLLAGATLIIILAVLASFYL